MGKLISSEELFLFAKGQKVKETGAFSKGFNKGMNVICSAAHSESTFRSADAVEVVRCKDCKNCWKCGWSHSVGDLYGCTVFDSEVRPNDFCSHGERKEVE